MPFTPRSAKNAKVRMNGSTLYHAGWNVSVEGDVIDTSHSEAAGARSQIIGFTGLSGNVKGLLDASANIHDSGLNVVVGAVITNLYLYMNGTTSPSWAMTSATITKVNEVAEMHDGLKYDFDFMSQEGFSYPSGTTNF